MNVAIGQVWFSKKDYSSRWEVIAMEHNGTEFTVRAFPHHPGDPLVRVDAKQFAAAHTLELDENKKPKPAQQELVVGSVVMLKSGGPPMTVESVQLSGRQCCWFTQWGDAQRIESRLFLVECLELAPESVNVEHRGVVERPAA